MPTDTILKVIYIAGQTALFEEFQKYQKKIKEIKRKNNLRVYMYVHTTKVSLTYKKLKKIHLEKTIAQ